MLELPETSELEQLLGLLQPSELAVVQRILEGRTRWAPQSKPQWQALLSPAFETLYGGAAGGGKSQALIGLALLCHRSSLLLRRTYPELEDSLILQSKEFYGDSRHYNGTRYVWQFPNGQRIRFGHVQRDEHVHSYQSAQFDLIGFDELTQFSKFQYEYLLSRARSVVPGQRVRVMGCTNPGSEGNDWVMERWAAWLDEKYPSPAAPGELRWFKREEDGHEVEADAEDPDARSRTFIPALLQDNPYLGDDYRKTLMMLPEPFRSQLLRGDWKAGQVDSAYQVIPTAWVKLAQARWTAQRPSGAQTCVGVDVARGGKDQTVLSRRYGTWFAAMEKHAGPSTPDGPSVAGLMAKALVDDGYANVDVIGIGASAFDSARSQGLAVVPVNFAAKSEATDRSGQLHFVNLRAEAYWRMREALDPEKGEHLALPPDQELLGDLTAPRWAMRAGGVQVESKEEIIKRLDRSPDCGDAAVLALLFVGEKGRLPLPRNVLVGGQRSSTDGLKAKRING